MKLQKGYLLIVVVILIVIVSFVGATLVYLFAGTTGSVSKFAQSDQALYLAMSGLEQSKRDVMVNGVDCNSVSAPTTSPIAKGVYTVAGVSNIASTTLVSINVDNTITLASTAGFTYNGLIAVDNEVIGYTGISGNDIQNIVRAVYGSISTHLGGANVTQNQCTLTAIGMVPSATSPEAQRKVQEMLVGAGASVPGSLLNLPGGILVTPGLISTQSINLSGNALVRNSYVTSGSSNRAGSTILTASSSVVFNGNGATQVNNGNGGWVTLSNKNVINDDVMRNAPINSSNLFGYVFDGETKTQVQYDTNTFICGNSCTTQDIINNVNAGKTIWVNRYLQLSSTTQIGSTTKPALIIVNDNVDLSGQASIYGLVYSSFGVSMSGKSYVKGAVIMEGALNINGNDNTGNSIIEMDQGILTKLKLMNNNTTIHYQSVPNNFQEVFQ